MTLLSRFRADEPPAYHGVSGLPDSEFHKLVAERIVNNIRNIEEDYRDYRFWARFQGEMTQFKQGPRFELMERAGLDLGNANDELAAELARVREELASKLDIPWAPYYEESLALPGR